MTDRRTSSAKLLELLRMYAYANDCPICFARPELLADVLPLSDRPGCQNKIVIPKGWKVTHGKSCDVGRALEESDG